MYRDSFFDRTAVITLGNSWLRLKRAKRIVEDGAWEALRDLDAQR